MHLLFQIYITTTKLEHFPLIIFVFVAANLPKLIYMKSVGMDNSFLFAFYKIIFDMHKTTAAVYK